MKIELDDNHIYTVDGAPMPSVSKVLNFFFQPTPFYTETGKVMGQARHLWYNAIVRGLELENEPDPRIAGSVAALRSFMVDVKPKYISGEVSYFDPDLRVCGTPDLVCLIEGVVSLVDFKPATKNKRTPLQTAAYATMIRNNGLYAKMMRYELRLHDDGKYRLDKHSNPDDEKRWPVLVAAYFATGYYR